MPEQTVTLCGECLDHPGHICAFFDSRAQEYDVLSPYYLEGIEQGEQVITIVDSDRHAEHCATLRSRGIAVDEAMERDSLKVLTSEDTYLKTSPFAATPMYTLLHGALQDAERQGRRVRTSGVMDWATRSNASTKELMEYEARVNFLVPKYDCTLLCVYDVDQISARMMMDVLATHPYVILHGRVRENSAYVPPIELLKQVLLEPPAQSRTAS